MLNKRQREKKQFISLQGNNIVVVEDIDLSVGENEGCYICWLDVELRVNEKLIEENILKK